MAPSSASVLRSSTLPRRRSPAAPSACARSQRTSGSCSAAARRGRSSEKDKEQGPANKGYRVRLVPCSMFPVPGERRPPCLTTSSSGSAARPTRSATSSPPARKRPAGGRGGGGEGGGGGGDGPPRG